MQLRTMIKKVKYYETKKKIHKYYKKLYNIQKVVAHEPKIPRHAYQLGFRIQWEGFPKVKDTIERWKKNKSLHNNIIVLQYMLSNDNLKRFVPE